MTQQENRGGGWQLAPLLSDAASLQAAARPAATPAAADAVAAPVDGRQQLAVDAAAVSEAAVGGRCDGGGPQQKASAACVAAPAVDRDATPERIPALAEHAAPVLGASLPTRSSYS